MSYPPPYNSKQKTLILNQLKTKLMKNRTPELFAKNVLLALANLQSSVNLIQHILLVQISVENKLDRKSLAENLQDQVHTRTMARYRSLVKDCGLPDDPGQGEGEPTK
jgi:hypothetical protein